MPTCDISACPSYAPGHHMHWIHAGHVGRRPWGWRRGILVSNDDGRFVIDYDSGEGTVVVWSGHAPQFEPGLQVRVHEEYWGLSIGGRLFNIRIESGRLGAVPEPDDPTEWAGQYSVGMVDMSTGEGVDVLAPDDEP